MINPFDDFPSEKLRLCKMSGEVIEDIETLFDPDELQIQDISLNIEEGDVFERALPNGKVERYEVIQCDYFAGTPDFPPVYDCKTRKLTGMHSPTKSASPTNNITATQANVVNDNTRIYAKQYKSFNSDESNSVVQTNNSYAFLFVTANDYERESFEKKFVCQKEQYILGKTYYLGMFGRYPAAYIHMDEQGVTSPAAAPLVSELVRELNPVAVVMVGIAFGADRDKQKIGDVLVSDKILPYDSQRLLENETEYKETPKEVGFQLLNAFREHRKWIYPLPNSEQSRVYIGAILTGSRLINNYAYRTQLLNDFAANRPIGGEMEAQGIYSMCRLHGVAEWIIVKGICDWGYEKNAPNKDELQIIAANAAVDYCFHVFSRDAFGDLVRKSSVGTGSTNRDEKESNSTHPQTGNISIIAHGSNAKIIGEISGGYNVFNMGMPPAPQPKDVYRKIFILLESKRIITCPLQTDCLFGCAKECVSSVVDIKNKIVKEAADSSLDEHDLRPANYMVATCNTFLETVRPYNGFGDAESFTKAVTSLRNSFREAIAEVERRYNLRFSVSISCAGR